MGSRLTAVLASFFLCLVVLVSPAQASFPGANGKIAFVHSTASDAEIYTINPDGSGSTPLTSSPGANYSPAWSPDGKKIAFVSSRDDSGQPSPGCSASCNSEIYVMNADGSNQARLTNDPSFDLGPQWSPDGTKIVFESGRTGNGDIYSMKADGTAIAQLTTSSMEDLDPSWSPDGTKIVYSGWIYDDVSNSDFNELLTMNPDGTGQAKLPSDGSFNKYQPDWSPDGTKVTYQHYDCGDDDCRTHSNAQDVATVRRDGTGQTDIDYPATAPAWSPDGSRIAVAQEGCAVIGPFSYLACAPKDIDTIAPDGTGRANLTNYGSGESASEPAWQPLPNRPPDCSGVAASRPVLTTANHQRVPITLDGATDPDGDSVTLSVDGVTQDEPVTGQGDHTSPDAVDQGDGEFRVRAERNAHGDGRVYRIAFTASDGRGGSCSDTATVSVPRKRHKPAIDSAPPSYDSFAR
jgi:Tol biopolymer transport system component